MVGSFKWSHCAGSKVHFPFRNGCIRSGPPAVFLLFPHQSLRSLFLFLLEPFSLSDPAGDRRGLLHIPLSIPEERSRIWHYGSSCGGLRCLNHANGDVGCQNPPCSDAAGEFVLHDIRHVAGIAGFQGDATHEARQHCCHGYILFSAAAYSCGWYQGHGDHGGLFKMEEVLNSIPDV